ncbi:MAG: HAD-IC family P-type ATPase, partial [Planctomycetes bacterium]|nr:HAD-IC family P-type ATPase [Planctomycetota bacterium]
MTTHTPAPGNSHAQSGLTATQVEESRRRYGANVLTPPRRDPWWTLYLEKFRDPIIRILMVAAVVAIFVGLSDGHFIEGVGIIIAILLATGIAFINEYQAAKKFDILNQQSDSEPVPVVRNGQHQSIPKREVVVGDLVFVEQGMEIPADGRVTEAVSLTVNESSLTGESEPVRKRPEAGDTTEDAAFGEDVVLRGTTVADGHGLIRVTAVGDATEIGKTARAASELTDNLTPLARQLERLASIIGVGAFLAAAVIFVAQCFRGAANGDVYDLAEQAGRLVRVPLEPGQWYMFLLLAGVVLILCAPIWAPVLRDGLTLIGHPEWFPKALKQTGRRGFANLATAAGIFLAAGFLIGIILRIVRWGPAEWLPVTALGAFLQYFMVAVTVIVVAVPEGLPMCVTLALAYSVRKMAASNNLVRKMHACETVGAASVICSDKTGTLTLNEMRVHAARFPFPPHGPAADRLAEAIAANSTAHLQLGDAVVPLGNPTEGALLVWLQDQGRDYEALRRAFTIRQQLTFSTERKFMATAGKSALDGQPVLYVKGAAEIVLARCTFRRRPDGGVDPLHDAARQEILADAAGNQNRGMRIIGFADREVDQAFLTAPLNAEAITGLVWDGYIAISDPIRPDVPAAIQQALDAGIAVKVVTGDNQATAREIARQAGLWRDDDTDDNLIRGEDFESLPDEEALAAAKRIKVMSRARPLHKMRLVNLLQRDGQVVAVTGDGTNDAPALN